MEVECCEILVVDDHPIVLEGIKKIASALEGVKCDGIMEVEQLEHYFSARSPYNMYSRILIYTMHEEPWMLAKLIDADIDGLVSKNADLSELQKAISALRSGETYFNEMFLDMIRHGKEFYICTENKGPNLSSREKEILAYIVKGFNNKQISELIYLSENTIKTYRKRLMIKIGAKNAADLVFKGKDFL